MMLLLVLLMANCGCSGKCPVVYCSLHGSFIHTILGSFGDSPVHFILVYAKCSYILRCHLWNDLVNLSVNIFGPWMVGGDFNVVRSNDEYVDSIPPLLSREFGDIITECNHYDLPFVGSTYTWCRSSSPPLWKCFDDIMINSKWNDFFISTKLEHLSKAPSDHYLFSSYLALIPLALLLVFSFRICG